jgi:alanyl-tRNA synthetase
LRIVKTERIQDGVERFEFAAGIAAILYDQERDAIINKSSNTLRVPPQQLPSAVARFFEEWKQRGKAQASAAALEPTVRVDETVGSIQVSSMKIDGDVKELLRISRGLLKDNAVVILGGVRAGQAHMVVTVGTEAAKKGINAAVVVKEACNLLGGSGGGRPERAQGGGPRADRIVEAIEKAKKLVREKLEAIGQAG